MLRVAFLLSAVLLAAGCGPGQSPPPATPATKEAEAAAYLGREACRRCHVEIFATYATTGMGRSWSLMRPDRAVEDFSRRNTIEIPASGLRYRMAAREASRFAERFRKRPSRADAPRGMMGMGS